MARKKTNGKLFLITIIFGIVIGLVIGYYAFFDLHTETKVVTQYVYEQPNASYNFAEIGLAAVDQDGNGVVTPLVVEAKPGDGKILTNIEKLLFWVDTQQSMQIAKQVAENVTGIDANKYDLVYTVRSNSTLVGGPSAGGALTAATIAALKGKKIKDDVMMTGTINTDGTIGQVGGVLEKAMAAKSIGVRIFLVPIGQGTETYYRPKESCVKRANFQFCTTKYIEVTTDIGQEANISVIEIRDVSDALKYLLA
jgi:uncharacterized protein